MDPTYQVRAVAANPNDSSLVGAKSGQFISIYYVILTCFPWLFQGIYCSELAQAAVHAAMAGYTGLTVGKVDQHVTRMRGSRGAVE